MADMSPPSNLDQWLKLLETRHPKTIDLGLERVGEVWSRMGAPKPAKRVFTVAGTNGKGSTVAYLSSMLGALGFRRGSYTSPHLLRYNERICIEEKEVSDGQLFAAFSEVEHARGEVGLSYFEHGTLAAFLLLHEAKLDFAVLEVGLGGRLDAVNLIDTDCAVITPIGLDHQEYLGPDRESIGREKAGILRRGIVAVSGEASPPDSVVQVAKDLHVPLLKLGVDFRISSENNALVWNGTAGKVTLPAPPLAGPHQHANLATALAALTGLLPQAIHSPGELAAGIAAVKLPGRLMSHPADSRLLIDVGHNPLAAEAIAAAFKAQGKKAAICVLAMLRDKDAQSVISVLGEQVNAWYCAGLAGERSRSGAELAGIVTGLAGQQPVHSFDTVAKALHAALQSKPDQAGTDDAILVFGSFHTAAESLDVLNRMAAHS